MDILWSPWRYSYIKSENASESGCVFCDLISDSRTDEEKFILYRGETNFVVLNIYPYISGHIMILPFRHVGFLSDSTDEESDEMMYLTRQSEKFLRDEYQPEGVNIGMNLGKAAGAGVAGHIHMHLLPRWVGDANFMTAIGQTRTVPESLETTYNKLLPFFRGL